MKHGKRCFVAWFFVAFKFRGIYGFALLFKALLTLFLVQVEQELQGLHELEDDENTAIC